MNKQKCAEAPFFIFTTRKYIYLLISSSASQIRSHSWQKGPFPHLGYRNISVCFNFICQRETTCHWRIFETYITHISICCYITNQLKNEFFCKDWCWEIEVKWCWDLSDWQRIVPNMNSSILLFKYLEKNFY